MPTRAYQQAVFDIVEDLRAYRAKRGDKFRYSDVYDQAGNQYVNLVQEGGGILGIALVGFTYVLEELGLRFLSLGGTSAGSINTLLMADMGQPAEKKSVRILERIGEKNFMDFVDGGYDAEQLTQAIESGNRIQLYLHLMTNFAEIKGDLGVNSGDHFEEWLSDILTHKDWQSLERNLRDLPEGLVEYIDVEGFNWINFSITEEEKLKLFRQGARAASRFLRRFDWQAYKENIKAKLLHRIKPVVWELSDLRDLGETLEVLGINDDQELEAKIKRIRDRPTPYNVLWIDDAFTYALPLAILERLHTYCYTVRYGAPLPPNIINRPGRNTIVHRHLVEEVVEGLSKITYNA